MKLNPSHTHIFGPYFERSIVTWYIILKEKRGAKDEEDTIVDEEIGGMHLNFSCHTVTFIVDLTKYKPEILIINISRNF